MLGKLIKHEFKATWKTYTVIYLALIALTVLTRISVEMPFENKIFDIVRILLSLAYVIVAVCVGFFSIVIGLERFYKNMLKDQGYLTHTLPVKEWQHIVTKTLVFTVWTVVSSVVAFMSVMLFGVGRPEFRNVLNHIGDMFSGLSDYPRVIAAIIMGIVLLIVQVAVNLLGFYAAFSLGQIFGKHRILGAVIFYFVLNYAMQLLMSVFMLLSEGIMNKFDNMSVEISGATGNMLLAQINSQTGVIMAFFGLCFVMEFIIAAVYFVITNFMLSKKLNLE